MIEIPSFYFEKLPDEERVSALILLEKAKKADGKVYKFCCIWQGQSVIMETKGLCTPCDALEEEPVCAPLPI